VTTTSMSLLYSHIMRSYNHPSRYFW